MTSKPMMVRLEEWAAARYSPPPSLWVLRRWARDGEIHPAPERVGRAWYVPADAQRITTTGGSTAQIASLVQRIATRSR